MRTRTGKIARLPRELRQLVNQMLDNGVPYAKILATLNDRRAQWPEGIDSISKMNLTKWKRGGYRDWCTERDIREERQVDRQSALDFLKENHGNDPASALNALRDLQLYNLMLRTDGRDMAGALKDNPDAYVRLLNALERMRKRA